MFYMGIDINRDMVWESMHGHKTKLKDMEDSHLINLHHYLTRRAALPWNNHETFDVSVMKVIVKVLDERGIKIKDFPTELPYEIDGEWYCNGIKATESQVLAYKLRLPIPQTEITEANINGS